MGSINIYTKHVNQNRMKKAHTHTIQIARKRITRTHIHTAEAAIIINAIYIDTAIANSYQPLALTETPRNDVEFMAA